MRRSTSTSKGGLRAAFFCLLACVAPSAAATHGDHEPRHGGIVGRTNHEVVVELVVEKDAVVLYLADEQERPVSTEKVSGTLILIPIQRPPQTVALAPAGGNKLAATGLKPARGDTLRAYFRLSNGDEVVSRFRFNR